MKNCSTETICRLCVLDKGCSRNEFLWQPCCLVHYPFSKDICNPPKRQSICEGHHLRPPGFSTPFVKPEKENPHGQQVAHPTRLGICRQFHNRLVSIGALMIYLRGGWDFLAAPFSIACENSDNVPKVGEKMEKIGQSVSFWYGIKLINKLDSRFRGNDKKRDPFDSLRSFDFAQDRCDQGDKFYVKLVILFWQLVSVWSRSSSTHRAKYFSSSGVIT